MSSLSTPITLAEQASVTPQVSSGSLTQRHLKGQGLSLWVAPSPGVRRLGSLSSSHVQSPHSSKEAVSPTRERVDEKVAKVTCLYWYQSLSFGRDRLPHDLQGDVTMWGPLLSQRWGEKCMLVAIRSEMPVLSY